MKKKSYIVNFVGLQARTQTTRNLVLLSLVRADSHHPSSLPKRFNLGSPYVLQATYVRDLVTQQDFIVNRRQ
jgi:hypothetical protein